MTTDSEVLKELAQTVIPELSDKLHKGSFGRIGVVGGCTLYTGAPYFAALSSLKIGADLVYIFCTKDAAGPIKSYSPETIVIPILDSEDAIEQLDNYFDKLHTIVIGPGLGRSPVVENKIIDIVNCVVRKGALLVLDADSVFFYKKYHTLLKDYSKAILTPNKYEFCRLYKDMIGKDLPISSNHERAVQELCQKLAGPTILRKGEVDLICDNKKLVTCAESGSLRRCGGQGDILAGSLGTFAYWADRCYREEPEKVKVNYGPTIVAAFAACMCTRRCSKLTFERLGRTATASDMIHQITNTFADLFLEKLKH